MSWVTRAGRPSIRPRRYGQRLGGLLTLRLGGRSRPTRAVTTADLGSLPVVYWDDLTPIARLLAYAGTLKDPAALVIGHDDRRAALAMVPMPGHEGYDREQFETVKRLPLVAVIAVFSPLTQRQIYMEETCPDQ